jgi:hypothetical protein
LFCPCMNSFVCVKRRIQQALGPRSIMNCGWYIWTTLQVHLLPVIKCFFSDKKDGALHIF